MNKGEKVLHLRDWAAQIAAQQGSENGVFHVVVYNARTTSVDNDKKIIYNYYKKGVFDLYRNNTIIIRHQWKKVEIEIKKIIYVIMHRQDAEIHVYGDKTYKARITCEELKKKLGECFIVIRRGCIVSAMAIRSITDTVNLMNGESLRYTLNKKTKLRNEIYRKQQEILESFADDAPERRRNTVSITFAMKMPLSHLQTLR